MPLKIAKTVKWCKLGNAHIFKCACTIGDYEPCDWMVSHLAKVKQKSDGRFEWTLLPNKGYSGDWPITEVKQGVFNSFEECQAYIEGIINYEAS